RAGRAPRDGDGDRARARVGAPRPGLRDGLARRGVVDRADARRRALGGRRSGHPTPPGALRRLETRAPRSYHERAARAARSRSGRRWRIMLGGLPRIALAALLLPALARGATFVVNTTADAVDATPGDGTCATSAGACSLRAAVQEANALAGQDAIAVPAGVFRLTLTGAGEDGAATGDLDVTEALAVTGAGADGTVIDGAGSDRVFHVVGGSGLALANLTIRNGDAGGAPGGGVWSAVPGAGLGVTNVVFAGNHAATGGAVFANDALSMSGSTFTDQVAGEGGAVVAAGSGAVAIDACRFASNFASGSGGGGRVQTTADVTVSGTSFADNFATSGGGGIFVQTSGNLLVSGGDFTENTGLGSGGGLVFQGQASSALTVSGTAFRGNRTLGPGGALASTAGGAASLGNVEMSGGHAA